MGRVDAMSDEDVPTSCFAAFRREFSWKLLGYTDVLGWNDGFTRSWTLTRRALLRVRLAFTVLIFALFVWSSINMGVEYEYKYWWIYITHWSLLVVLLYFVSAAYTQSQAVVAEEAKSQPTAAWWMYLSWVLHDIAYPASFFVTVMFWLLVFEPPLKAFSVFTHGVNYLIMLADVILSSQPYRLAHGLYFILYAIIYIFWSLIHHWAKGRNHDGDRFIYSSLDYKEDAGGAVGTIVTAFVGFIFVLLPILWITVHVRSRKAKIELDSGKHAEGEATMTIDNPMSNV